MRKIKKIKRHNLLIRFIKLLIRIFKKKPKIVNIENQELPEKAIYIANHVGAKGPIIFSVFFSVILVPWGAFPMTGNYIERWKYLYFVFYRQKLKYGKIKSIILASLFGLISRILYNGVYLIPTYPDLRLRKTIVQTLNHLESNNSILIFPEDSSMGYKDEIQVFHGGFVYLAKKYRDRYQEDIPIIPLFYNRFNNQIIVGRKYYLKDFLDKIDYLVIAEKFKEILNNLSDNE
jgi:1-acyl-sn-glycerol-3-phosphate acyltransferase